MKILVTGYTGQLGFDLVSEGLQQGMNILGISSKDVDITNEKELISYIKNINPSVIIHCAAYTAVDNAEVEKEKCWNVNVNGTNYLSKIASDINSKFLYISTDYVFNGESNTVYSESSVADPISYYGKTKLEGEKIVQSLLKKFFILRVSWVFGINGKNFINTMINLSKTKSEINVVGDQYGSPTYTKDLARLILDMIKTEKYGIYNVTNEGFCSWAQFAEEIFKQLNINIKINTISTEEYITQAKRPKNSKLSKQKLIDFGFNPLPSWQDAVRRYLTELSQEVK